MLTPQYCASQKEPWWPTPYSQRVRVSSTTSRCITARAQNTMLIVLGSDQLYPNTLRPVVLPSTQTDMRTRGIKSVKQMHMIA
jgi:hypothetical protein